MAVNSAARHDDEGPSAPPKPWRNQRATSSNKSVCRLQLALLRAEIRRGYVVARKESTSGRREAHTKNKTQTNVSAVTHKYQMQLICTDLRGNEMSADVHRPKNTQRYMNPTNLPYCGSPTTILCVFSSDTLRRQFPLQTK